MKRNWGFAIFGLILIVFTPFVAKSANEPIYVYEGISVQDTAEATQELIRKEEMRAESYRLNKVGEFLYSAKDSFFMSIGDTLANMVRFISASTKTLGVGKETNAKLLSVLDNARLDRYANKSLADLRLGVESDALSNKIAIVVFCPIGSVLFGRGILHRTDTRKLERSIYHPLYK